MQTAEHLDANATASELDRFLDGPVQPGDVDAMLEALKGAVAVAPTTPEAARSLAVNASAVEPGPEACKISGPALALNGTLPFLLAAERALNAQSPKFQHVAISSERAFTAA